MSEIFEMESMIRGKRSKRQRPMSPISLAMPNSSSSSTTTSSNPTSGSWSAEEEDMAHCLILLARGQAGPTGTQEPELEIPASSENPRFARGFKVVGSDNNLLLTSYQCQTCDRCFPSFQALGGHRASHKIKAKEVSGNKDPQNRGTISKQSSISSATALTLEIPNRVVAGGDFPTKSKVHECTICGVEFASGQALGGHMRRHRALPGPTGPDVAKKQRTTQLGLDLNLPAAPEEELREAKYFPAAAGREQVILFSASPLVDCCRY